MAPVALFMEVTSAPVPTVITFPAVVTVVIPAPTIVTGPTKPFILSTWEPPDCSN